MPSAVVGAASGVRLLIMLVAMLVLGLGLWLRFRLCLLDWPKRIDCAADLPGVHGPAVFGFHAFTAHRDSSALREKPGDLLGPFRSDADHHAVVQERAAKLALGAEQREAHRSRGGHLPFLDFGMFAVVIRAMVDDLGRVL